MSKRTSRIADPNAYEVEGQAKAHEARAEIMETQSGSQRTRAGRFWSPESGSGGGTIPAHRHLNPLGDNELEARTGFKVACAHPSAALPRASGRSARACNETRGEGRYRV